MTEKLYLNFPQKNLVKKKWFTLNLLTYTVYLSRYVTKQTLFTDVYGWGLDTVLMSMAGVWGPS